MGDEIFFARRWRVVVMLPGDSPMVRAMSAVLSRPEARAQSTPFSTSEPVDLRRRPQNRVAKSMAVMVNYELRFTSYELLLVDGEVASLAEFEGEAGEFNDALCDEAAGVFVVAFVFLRGKE